MFGLGGAMASRPCTGRGVPGVGGQNLAARVGREQQGQPQPQALRTSLGMGRGQARMFGWCDPACGQAQPNGCWKWLPRPWLQILAAAAPQASMGGGPSMASRPSWSTRPRSLRGMLPWPYREATTSSTAQRITSRNALIM